MKFMSVKDFEKRMASFVKPQSDAELEILSAIYFGKPLHAGFDVWESTEKSHGRYEVKEDYDSYHGKEWEFGKRAIDGYTKSEAFWKYVFGPLYCGGIARASYGQFHVVSHRDLKRLMRWKDSRSSGDSGRVRQAFARLAKQHGLGENSSTPDGGCTA